MATPKTSNGFTLNGPVNPTVPGIIKGFAPTTNPVSSALNKMQSGGATWQPTAQSTPSVTNPVAGFGGSAQQKQAGLITPPSAPTAPIKSQTKNNVDGSSETVTYHNPVVQNNTNTGGTISDPNATQRADIQSKLSAAQNELTTKQAEQKAAEEKAQRDKTTYQGLVGQGQGLYQQLPGLGQQAADITAEAQKKYQEIGQKGAQGQAGYLSGMGTNPVAAGNASIVAQNVAAQQGAVTQGAQLGLTGLSQQAGNITGAAAGVAGLAGLTPEILRYGGANGQPMTAEEATQYKAKLDALGQGTGAAAIDTQAINGAESGIQSITDLIKKGNLNPSNVNILNEGIQAIQKNLSNADYQTLLNSLEAINAALTKVTGTPVDIATLSSSQGTSLIATINNQVQIAKAFAAGKAKAQTTQSQTNPLGLEGFN